MKIIDLNELYWREKTLDLLFLECQFDNALKEKKFSKRKAKKIRKKMDEFWINSSDYFPKKNKSLEQCFNLYLREQLLHS